MNLDSLNEKQKEAVIKSEGPLLVLAGAGSGKTRVLTTKVAYLILELGVSPSSILAITFTNKAAKEMKERIISMIGNIGYQIQISTFHSFGLMIIRENYSMLGLDKNFTILDSDDSNTIIKKICKDKGLDPKVYNPKMIKNKISSAKNELLDSKGYSKYAFTEFEEEVVSIYEKYEEKLRLSNSLDFDDLLMLPIKLFKSHPEILQKYQERFKYVLVDEYQDTNEAQYILTKMISAKYKNICVVGDNDQSIYAFRGANYKNILNFEADYKNPSVIMLEENYRSTKNILNCANCIIKNNKERKDKNLWTSNEEGDKIKYHKANDEKDEASYVALEVLKLINQGVSRNDIAILYRTNAQSRNLEEAFLKNNIPYKVVGSFYFYKRKEIKDLICYLKLLYNIHDDVSLTRIINVPKRGIGLKTIENLENKALEKKTSMYNSIESGKELLFKNTIEKIRNKQNELSLTELVDYILDETGMKAELESEKSIEADIRLENLEEFKTITKHFEERDGSVSLEEFLEEISLVADIEEHKDLTDVVTLMTIHSSKGLEFDYVFLVGMEEGIFPHSNSFSSSEDLEEERRLCYVAITRAKKNLCIVNARKRTIFGQDNYNVPSRFVEEINPEYLSVDIFEKEAKIIDKTSMIDTTQDYNVGDKIEHDTFGIGVVVSISKSILTVAFKNGIGIKTLMKGHKAIRKV
jgi:DNA helicase-2/ATP-dependent DNA helicase PcrA